MVSPNKIPIPEKSRTPKLFAETPSEATIKTIVDFIRAGGKPHLCPWHTHTNAPEGAIVDYLEEFTIPGSKGRPHLWGACPCCTDCYPKYRVGLVAWFPEERVVRLVGRDCFERLNPEAHKSRYRELKRRGERSRQIAYLLSNLHIVDDVRSVIATNKVIAQALDEVRKSLQQSVALLGIPLWDHIRDGNLHQSIEEVVTTADKSGQTRESTRRSSRVYASVRGQEILDPTRSSVLRLLVSADQQLASIAGWRDFLGLLPHMSDAERAKIARALKAGLRGTERASDEIDRLQCFFRRQTLSTLRRWSTLPNCTCRFSLELQDGYILIGTDRYQKVRVNLPTGLSNTPRRLSPIASSLSASADGS